MKLLAIELVGTDLASVVADERLEHLRRLMEIGTYGSLEGDAASLGGVLDRAGERRRVDASPVHPHERGGARRAIPSARARAIEVDSEARIPGSGFARAAS